MIFALMFGVIGATGLLAVFGVLSSGRLRIDDANIITRREKPATFFAIAIVATVVFGGMLAAVVAEFWGILSSGQG